jgi:hypothetical protein
MRKPISIRDAGADLSEKSGCQSAGDVEIGEVNPTTSDA